MVTTFLNLQTNNMLTLRQINAEIEKRYPKVFLVKGRGYYYLASDDDRISLKLAALYTTSIAIFRMGHLSLDRWMQEVRVVLNDAQRHPSERRPVFPEKKTTYINCKIETNGVVIFFDGKYSPDTDTLIVTNYFGDITVRADAFQDFAITNGIANVIFK